MYHGIVINKQFADPAYSQKFKTINSKISGDWEIFCIEVEDRDLKAVIREVQEGTIPNEPWYAHFYNDDPADAELIVVFKDKVMTATPHISSWSEIFEYGSTLNIPEDQLHIWPNRFQDERHYFKK